MYIKKLKLKNYRNYEEINVDFDKGINIIYGNNAVGKTNLLESIYICSTSKSHKNSKENEIINFNKDEAHIKLFLEKLNKENIIDIQFNKNDKKGIAKNGIKINKISEYIGFLNVVIFSPEDLNIIKEGPSVRRKFIDIQLCQIDKIYVKTLSNYNKILKQRNIILKDISNAKINIKNDLINLLNIYDEKLINYGIIIINKRKEYIEKIKDNIYNIHLKITDNKEKLIINYENDLLNNIDKNENLIDVYKNKIEENKEKDLNYLYTSIGPHRDDISFKIDDKDIRNYGSQGQKKTVAISLKLSELDFIKNKINELPILLLDDVFSELDEYRQKKLIDNIKNIQTIITCTGIKKNIFEILKPNKIFNVKNNNIKEIKKKENN